MGIEGVVPSWDDWRNFGAGISKAQAGLSEAILNPIDTLEPVSNVLGNVGESILDAGTGGIDSIANFAGNVGDAVLNAGTGAVDSVVDAVGNVVGKTKSTLSPEELRNI